MVPMHSLLVAVALALSIPTTLAIPASNGTHILDARQSSSQITHVDLSVNTGNSVHRASGILYGVPDNGDQISSNLYTDMGFNYLSAGGAQDPGGSRGWIFGSYPGRFQSALRNYRTAKKYNAQFILKMSDLWGADGGQGNAAYPGDNGDFTEYDRFLTQLVSDLKSNGMTDLKLLIWNEPDLTIFWNRSPADRLTNSTREGQEQYFSQWSHALILGKLPLLTLVGFRANLAGVPIAGPSFAFRPDPNSNWWRPWVQRIKTDNTPPDVYTWHLEGDTTDPTNDLPFSHDNMVNMLNSAGLKVGEFVIDEYANSAEQNPAGGAWWIAGFERWNMYGMRGNWLSGYQLHDFFASLLYKTQLSATGTGYFTNGEYQVYKYYASTMQGYRVRTTRSTDGKMDSYSVVDSSARKVRTLVGGRLVTGTWSLQFDNLSALGLPSSGSITVHTYEFPWKGATGRVDGPTDLGTVVHAYSDYDDYDLGF
ncbi:hypothetical protein V5O48_010421 [Marasmius crinis-equi]|uniref:Glycoside hydrolase family 39 protein n=1 Tax=Marasmius crinis-equi TaxID=585013 RepID=A0ABR3F8E0_9AGAR